MENLTTTQAAGAGILVGGVLTAMIIMVIAIYVLFIIAAWKIFDKAGVAGWKSIIPVYNLYKFCQIIGISFWIYVIAIPVGLGIVSAIVPSIQSVLTSIYTIFIEVFMAIKLGKAFGKSTGFIVGLIFLSSIFELILAFGSSKYVGDYKEA